MLWPRLTSPHTSGRPNSDTPSPMYLYDYDLYDLYDLYDYTICTLTYMTVFHRITCNLKKKTKCWLFERSRLLSVCWVLSAVGMELFSWVHCVSICSFQAPKTVKAQKCLPVLNIFCYWERVCSRVKHWLITGYCFETGIILHARHTSYNFRPLLVHMPLIWWMVVIQWGRTREMLTESQYEL